jgi:hypothetical protein
MAGTMVALVALCACTLRDGARPSVDEAAAALAVARDFYGALHRGDAARAAALVATREAGRATDAFVKLARAYQTVEDALRERFGARAGDAVGYAARVAAEDEALRRAEARVDGAQAVVTSGENTLATLQKVGRAWRIVLEDALATDEGLARLASEADGTQRAALRVVPAIRGGLFESPEDALQAFRNELGTLGGVDPDRLPGPPGEEEEEGEREDDAVEL